MRSVSLDGNAGGRRRSEGATLRAGRHDGDDGCHMKSRAAVERPGSREGGK